jgi:hypothetical protein
MDWPLFRAILARSSHHRSIYKQRHHTAADHTACICSTSSRVIFICRRGGATSTLSTHSPSHSSPCVSYRNARRSFSNHSPHYQHSIMDVVFSNIVHYLSGDFPFRNELTNFCMAFQGHLSVRNGRNKDGSMNWFHAFMLGVVCCFGGSSFAPLWLGKPSSILANDLGLFSLIISFITINCMPFDIGNKLGKTFPAKLFCTTFVSLFKTMGIVGYTAAGYQAFKASPSEYYPIPIFGPIVWATLLGNMSAFFVKGFDEHLKNGMPWAFQNGELLVGFGGGVSFCKMYYCTL